jgi:spermidine synthase
MAVVDRVKTPRGELVLRRDGEHFEVISNCLAGTDARFDVICVDIDNGPDWTVTEANAEPGGVLTVWSAARSSAYEQVLRRHFGKVEVIEVPVPRGDPDVVFAASRAVAQTQGRDSDSS